MISCQPAGEAARPIQELSRKTTKQKTMKIMKKLIFITYTMVSASKSSKCCLKHSARRIKVEMVLCFKRHFDDVDAEAIVYVMKINFFMILIFLFFVSGKFLDGVSWRTSLWGGRLVLASWLTGWLAGWLPLLHQHPCTYTCIYIHIYIHINIYPCIYTFSGSAVAAVDAGIMRRVASGCAATSTYMYVCMSKQMN